MFWNSCTSEFISCPQKRVLIWAYKRVASFNSASCMPCGNARFFLSSTAAFILHQQSYERKMLFCLLLKLNTKLQEHFSNGWLYKRYVSDEFNRMPIAGAFVFNFNVKFTSVFGGHSLLNNTYYEIFLLLKATFFFPETFL